MDDLLRNNWSTWGGICKLLEIGTSLIVDAIRRGDWGQIILGLLLAGFGIYAIVYASRFFGAAFESGQRGVDLVSWALFDAARRGDAGVILDELNKGTDINKKDREGLTPLMYACASGTTHDDVVKLLIERGADINLRDKDGGTALMHAVVGGHVTTAKLLLERGADINAVTEGGSTVLKIAHKTNNPQMIELLENPSTIRKVLSDSGRVANFPQQEKKNKLKDIAYRQVSSHSPIPLSIKDISPAILTDGDQLTTNIREGIGSSKWYSFSYAKAPNPICVDFLAKSETAPIEKIEIELGWTKTWHERLLPVCVEQIVTIISAITEITPDGIKKIKRWLSEAHRENSKLKTKIITLEISSPLDGGQRKVLSIWNSQERLLESDKNTLAYKAGKAYLRIFKRGDLK